MKERERGTEREREKRERERERADRRRWRREGERKREKTCVIPTMNVIACLIQVCVFECVISILMDALRKEFYGW